VQPILALAIPNPEPGVAGGVGVAVVGSQLHQQLPAALGCQRGDVPQPQPELFIFLSESIFIFFPILFEVILCIAIRAAS